MDNVKLEAGRISLEPETENRKRGVYWVEIEVVKDNKLLNHQKTFSRRQFEANEKTEPAGK